MCHTFQKILCPLKHIIRMCHLNRPHCTNYFQQLNWLSIITTRTLFCIQIQQARERLMEFGTMFILNVTQRLDIYLLNLIRLKYSKQV